MSFRMRSFRALLFSLLLAVSNASAGEIQDKNLRVVDGARSQINRTVYYDPSYKQITYPGGDLAIESGVCTDVVIRALRHLKVDLQVLVHEDMRDHFHVYPKTWGLKAPDTNIDHRRVPNLMTFFDRAGKALPVSSKSEDYLPGDFVVWRLPQGLLHIGVVSDRSSDGTPLVIHNIGEGAREEDILFSYQILGHYRYFK